MENENYKYLLVMEPIDRPGDYAVININLLGLNEVSINYSTMLDIDNFTSQFSKNALIEAIRNSNIVLDKYLNGDVYVIKLPNGSKKYSNRYPVLTQDVIKDIDIVSFIYANIKNKDVLNTIKNVYGRLINGLAEYNIVDLQNAIVAQDVREITKLLLTLPYEKRRELRLFITNRLINEDKENVLSKEKAA
jgi:hypothetical protein